MVADSRDAPSQLTLLLQLLRPLLDAARDLIRAFVLTALFTPVLLTMPFALQLGWQREHWLTLLRYRA